MDDRTMEAGLAPVLMMAVEAYAEACAAARAWGEGPASRLVDLLGQEHAHEIEELRDAAVHQAAVEPGAAATARALIKRCLEIVERGTRVDEQCEWEEDGDGMPYVVHRYRKSALDEKAEAAIQAAKALRIMAEAIERSLDVDAALERYGVHVR